MIVTQDSRGVLRGLTNFKQWNPLYISVDDKKTTKLWMIGVHGYDFIGIVLEKDDYEPSVYSRPPVKSLKMKFPFLDEESYYTQKNHDILKK